MNLQNCGLRVFTYVGSITHAKRFEIKLNANATVYANMIQQAATQSTEPKRKHKTRGHLTLSCEIMTLKATLRNNTMQTTIIHEHDLALKSCIMHSTLMTPQSSTRPAVDFTKALFQTSTYTCLNNRTWNEASSADLPT
jgi:hypothetical protein